MKYLIKSEESLKQFISSESNGSFYIGHASVLVKHNNKLFFIDPVFSRPLFLESWLFYPDLIFDELLFNVDGVFISHYHDDHYDKEFLRKLKKDTPIYISEGRTGFDEIVKDRNFNVIQVPTNTKYPICDDGFFYSIPSDHNSFDSSIILKFNDFSIYQGNDNFVEKKSIEEAHNDVGDISHVYVPYSYVWWYPFCLKSISDEFRNSEIKRLTKKNMDIGIYMAEILNADIVIPMAGNLVFHDFENSLINYEIASPFDFIEYVNLSDHNYLKNKTFPLLSGDSIHNNIDSISINTKKLNKIDYKKNMEKFLSENKKYIKLDPDWVTKLLKRNFFEDNNDQFKITIYITDKSEKKDFFVIDLFKQITTSQNSVNYNEDNSLIFEIDSLALNNWSNQSIDFESVLNSQRFNLYRNPEVFDQDLWNFIRTKL